MTNRTDYAHRPQVHLCTGCFERPALIPWPIEALSTMLCTGCFSIARGISKRDSDRRRRRRDERTIRNRAARERRERLHRLGVAA